MLSCVTELSGLASPTLWRESSWNAVKQEAPLLENRTREPRRVRRRVARPRGETPRRPHLRARSSRCISGAAAPNCAAAPEEGPLCQAPGRRGHPGMSELCRCDAAGDLSLPTCQKVSSASFDSEISSFDSHNSSLELALHVTPIAKTGNLKALVLPPAHDSAADHTTSLGSRGGVRETITLADADPAPARPPRPGEPGLGACAAGSPCRCSNSKGRAHSTV